MPRIPAIDFEGDVSPEEPDAPISLAGIDHITIEGGNRADTIAFYRDILGMRLVIDQPNRDRPSLDHLFFDTGDGRLLTFFVTEDHETDSSPLPLAPGSVHHISYRVAVDDFDTVINGLEANGYPYSTYSRSGRESAYTRDHNGLTIEITTDNFGLPAEHRNSVLAVAHQYRLDEGADYLEDRHVQQAIEAMDVPVDRPEGYDRSSDPA